MKSQPVESDQFTSVSFKNVAGLTNEKDYWGGWNVWKILEQRKIRGRKIIQKAFTRTEAVEWGQRGGRIGKI